MIQRIKFKIEQGASRREISNELNLKYSTLTRYIRAHNLQPSTQTKGRPLFSYDKSKRSRVSRVSREQIDGDKFDGGQISGGRIDVDRFDVDRFIKSMNDIANEPITATNADRYEKINISY